MKKRFVLLLSLMAILVLALPAIALAADYPVWVNGEQFSDSALSIDCGNGTATLTPPTNAGDPYILTLDGAEITGTTSIPNDYAGNIYSKVELEIVLKGDNTVTATKAQDAYCIYSIEDLTLSGDGNLTLDELGWNDAIVGHADFTSEMNGDLVINSGSVGITAVNDIVFKGSGDVTIDSENTGLTSGNQIVFNTSGDVTVNSIGNGVSTRYGNIELGGSGNIQITSDDNNCSALLVSFDSDGELILSGSGEVTLTSKQYCAVYMYYDDSHVLLNGTAPRITMISASGKSAIEIGNPSPVSGTNFSKYVAIEGTPTSDKLVYALVQPITEVSVTGAQTPVAGEYCTTDTVEIETDPEDAFIATGTGAPVITWYDETDGKTVAVTDTFVKDHEYSLRLQIQPKLGYLLPVDSNKNYTGTASFDGETAESAKVEDSVLSLIGPTVKAGLLTYEVTVAVNNASMGTAKADVAEAAEGDLITLTAVPGKGYYLQKWLSDEVTVDASAGTFTMPGKKVKVTAVFDTVTLTEITVTKAPTKTEYREGETFDPAGLEITAKFNDGTSAPVTDYTFVPSGALKLTDTEVEISYTVNGVTKSVKVPITVKAGVYSIIEGANAKWEKGGSDLLIVSDAPFAKFVSVKVNDTVLDPANYKASEGSTRILLLKQYLEGLKEESYRFEIVSSDGSAATIFSVLSKKPVNYLVTFNMNGHGKAVDSQTVPEGEKAREPKVKNVGEWVFGGWYQDSGCKIKFNFNAPITKDTIVYAKWTKDLPETGDDTDIAGLAVMLLVAVGTMLTMTVMFRRKRG